MADPGILRFVLRVFYEHKTAGKDVDTSNLCRALNQLVVRHAPLGHGSEVSWCIWGAAVLGVSLNESAAKAIESMADDIVALTAMCAEPHGAFEHPPSRTRWQELAQNSTLFDEHWLLGYEAIGKQWVRAPKGGDQAGSDEFFHTLRTAHVEFVDDSVELEIPSMSPSGPYR